MHQARHGLFARGWRFLREALEGTSQDFTEGSLSRGIALLAIPTVVEMAMESTFGLVDGIWVSRLGAAPIAAVGLTEALLILIFSFALGLSTAATAAVARRVGEKNLEGAAVAAVQAIACGVLAGIVVGIGGAYYAPRLLELMHAEPEVVRAGSGYAAVLLG